MRIIGTVTDTATGKPLPFANVYYSEKDGRPAPTNIGATTNAAGKYDLGTFVGSLRITASFIGYKKQVKRLPPEGPGTHVLNFELTPEATTLPEVNIIAKALPAKWPQRLAIGLVIAGLIYGIYKLMKPRYT
jgi:hypothetical protein